MARADRSAAEWIAAWVLCLAVGVVGMQAAAAGEEEPDEPPLLESAEPTVVTANTALHAAVRANDLSAVMALIKHPTNDISAVDPIGYTPLMAAIRQYRALRTAPSEAQAANRQIVMALLDAGADLNGRMPGRDEPLLLYVRRSRPETALFAALLAHGADPNIRHQGKPLLHYLLFQHDLEFARLAIAHGADVNAAYDHGIVVGDYRQCTALHYSALMQTRLDETVPQLDSTTDLLLAAGADVNRQDALGNTALHYSAWFGRSDMVRALLAHGADAGIRNQQGYLPLTRAHFSDTVELLVPVTPTATAQDVATALKLERFSAATGLHQVATRYSSPAWLASWALVLGLLVFILRRKVRALPPVPGATASPGGHAVRRSRRKKPLGAGDDLEPSALKPTLDAQATRLARLRARFLRMRLWALAPLALWGVAWLPFFFDPYLQALGLIENLSMLAGGILLCGLVANLFAQSEKARVTVAVLGMLGALAAGGRCLYWSWLFYHFQDLCLALLYTGTAVGALGLGAVFWNSFSVHWILWRAGRGRQVKLTAADELETLAGWDRAEG